MRNDVKRPSCFWLFPQSSFSLYGCKKMAEQSLNSLLGSPSTQDSSLMTGVSHKGHHGQAKEGDMGFLSLLANSIGGEEGETNQNLVSLEKRQSSVPLSGEPKLLLEIFTNRNTLVTDNRKVLTGKGENNSLETESILDAVMSHTPDSGANSTPIHEDTLLHLLFSDRSQGLNGVRDLLENPKDLVILSKETPTNNPVILSSTKIPIVQIQGSGLLSGQSLASTVGSNDTLPVPSQEKQLDLNPNTNPPIPQNSQQKGVEGWMSTSTLSGTDILEKETNQKYTKIQGLDMEQVAKPTHTVTNSDKVVHDGEEQSLKILKNRAVGVGASLVSEDGVKSRAIDQSVLRSLHTISQEIPNTRPLARDGGGEKEKESGKRPSGSKFVKSLDISSSTSTGNSNINTLIRSESAATTTTGDSVIAETLGTAQRGEVNQNLLNIKQDLDPRVQSLNTSKEISVTSTPESLSSDMTDHITQRAKLFLQGGKSEVKLQLNPPELGGLKLEFSVVDDVLETKISVEKSMIKEIIEKDIPKIRELLSQTDIDVGRLDVTLQEREGARQDFMNKGFLSDRGSKSEGDLSHGDNEGVDEEGEEEMDQAAINSTSIDYLV